MVDEIVAEEAAEETTDSLLTEGTVVSEDVKEPGLEADSKADVKVGDDTVPEAYEFKIEGVELDQAQVDEFSPVAKELGLSQDKAQKLVGLYAKIKEEGELNQQKQWAETISTWREEATKDTDYGGLKFQESLGMARKTLDAFGNEKVKQALNDSGMGNHPEMIRLFVNIGRAISDDSFVFGKAAQAAPKSHADILFPNQGKN